MQASTKALPIRSTSRPLTPAGTSREGWVIDWGDGQIAFSDPSLSSDSHTYADNGNYSVSVTAVAADGDSGTETLALQVNNVAPTVGITACPTTRAPEGTALSFGSSVSDPGVNDTFTYGWTVYKNGVHFILPNGTNISSSNFTFTPTDNGSYVVRLTVEDNDGGSTTENSSAITVTNVNPTAVVSGEPVGSINEGDTVNLAATPSDAGSADTFTYSWSVTKNGGAYALPNGTNTTSSNFTFTPNDNGSYVATVVVHDDDGGSATVSSQTITAVNVNPTATITGEPVATIDEGSSVTLTAHPADDGSADTFTYAWSVIRTTRRTHCPTAPSPTPPASPSSSRTRARTRRPALSTTTTAGSSAWTAAPSTSATSRQTEPSLAHQPRRSTKIQRSVSD